MRKPGPEYEAIVLGCSAGGLDALETILAGLHSRYRLPLVAVQHRSKSSGDLLEEVLQAKCSIPVRQAGEKEPVLAPGVYIAPPDYHLLIEEDGHFSLSADNPVRYSRPSIDVLFESAATAYGNKLIAIILTGANDDGAAGITAVKENGGYTIAQDPAEALFPAMPRAAIETGSVSEVLNLSAIADFLIKTGNEIHENS